MASILISTSAPLPHHHFQSNAEPKREGVWSDLTQLSAKLKQIRKMREEPGCYFAKKKDLNELIEEIKLILEESERNGLNGLLSREKGARQDLQDIKDHITVLAPNKTQSQKLNKLLSRHPFQESAQFPVVDSVHEQLPCQRKDEPLEEKYSVGSELTLKAQLLELQKKGSEGLIELLKEDVMRAVERCILCINDRDLNSICNHLFWILSKGMGIRLENRSEIIEGLAKNLHRITGKLPDGGEAGSIFTHNLLLCAKVHHPELAQAKSTVFINNFKFFKMYDMPFAAVWPSYQRGIKKSIEGILIYKMLNEALVYERICHFINEERHPLNSWAFLLDNTYADIRPYLCSKITHINVYACDWKTQVQCMIAIPDAQTIEIYPESSIAIDRARGSRIKKDAF